MNKKYIYTMYIYSKSANFAFLRFYPIVILWLSYSYPMVNPRGANENGKELYRS